MLNLYQIAAVSRRTGLSIDTIRAWEKRYQLVMPARSETGVREYSEGDIERLTLARAACVLGHPIRRVAIRTNDELRALVADAALPKASRGLPKPATVQTVESILDAVAHYDLETAETQLSSAVLLFTPSELICDVLSPLMNEVGRRWEASALTIAQEHFASNIVRSVIGSLMRVGPPKDRQTMLFVTPPNELHEFGILFAACLASLHGNRSIVLGPSVPANEVVAAARVIAPASVVVGLTVRERADEFGHYLAELRSDLPQHVALSIGGDASAAFSELAPRGLRVTQTLGEFSDMLRKHHM